MHALLLVAQAIAQPLAIGHLGVSIAQAAKAGVGLPQVHGLPAVPGQRTHLLDQRSHVLAFKHHQAARRGQDPLEDLGAGLRWSWGHGDSHQVPVLRYRCWCNSKAWRPSRTWILSRVPPGIQRRRTDTARTARHTCRVTMRSEERRVGK